MVPSRSCGERGITDTRSQVVQCLQYVGVAPKETGHQNSQKQDNEGQEEYENEHDVSFASRERRKHYWGTHE
jgi:hypothetical protein